MKRDGTTALLIAFGLSAWDRMRSWEATGPVFKEMRLWIKGWLPAGGMSYIQWLKPCEGIGSQIADKSGKKDFCWFIIWQIMKTKKICESLVKRHWETFFLSFRAVRKVEAKSDLVSFHFLFCKSIDHKYCDGIKRICVTWDSHNWSNNIVARRWCFL